MRSSQGNQYQEVHYGAQGGSGKQGFCGACACSLFGIVLYFACLCGIAVNEVGTVCVSKALEQARYDHEEVRCTAQDTSGRGDLIYFACPIAERSLKTFTPQDFSGAQWLEGAFATKAVKMSQQVSMFQCAETKKERKEGSASDKSNKRTIITYEYNMVWSDSPIEDKRFKGWDNNDAKQALSRGCGRDFKGNPPFSMRSQDLNTNALYAGDYDVTRHLGKVRVEDPVQLQQGRYSAPTGDGSGGRRVAKDGQSYTRGEFIDHYGEDRGKQEWDGAGRGRSGESVEVFGNTINTCAGEPALGCLRVSYRQSSISHASLLAAQSKGQIGATKAWAASASWMCSSSSSSSQVDLFAEGAISAHELVDNALSANSASTWLIRVALFFCVIAGVYSFLQPIQAIADMIDQFLDWFKFIPILGWLLDFLGDVVSGAVGMAIFVISIGIGAPSAFAVMSLSWLVMRPLIGVPMVLACAAVIAMTVKAMVDYASVGKERRAKKS